MKDSSIIVETGHAPQWAVLWLHGLGADGNDFAPIVPELVAKNWPAVRFVFPHAPVRAVTINGGMRMRAWYDIYGFSPSSRQDTEGLQESFSAVHSELAALEKSGFTHDRLLLAGFSQGGAVTLGAGLRYPRRLGGLIALSTYLPISEALGAQAHASNADVPIFMAHGAQDPVIPQSRGEASRDALRRAGYQVDWHSYAMPHSVCPQEIADLQKWLGERFRNAAGAR